VRDIIKIWGRGIGLDGLKGLIDLLSRMSMVCANALNVYLERY
jgi:hypothetical protein